MMKTFTIALSFAVIASSMSIPPANNNNNVGQRRRLESEPSNYGGGGVGRPSHSLRCEDRWGCNECAEYGVCVWVNDHFGPRCQNALPIDDCSSPAMHCSLNQCPATASIRIVEVWDSAVAVPNGYSLISSSRACEENNQGITRSYGAGGHSPYTCTLRCNSDPNCKSFDFFSETGWCNTYNHACSSPRATKDGASSFRKRRVEQPPILVVEEVRNDLVAVPDGYALISSTRACEDNYEGISKIDGATGHSLNTCRRQCNNDPSCRAFDFYSETGWCNTYTQACSSPRTTKDGASSFKKIAYVTPKLVGCGQCVSEGRYFDRPNQRCVDTQADCFYMTDIMQCIPPSFSHLC